MAAVITRNGRYLAPFRNFVTGAGAFTGIDIVRTEEGNYRVELPVAGYKPEEIEVTLEENVLTVAGKSERRQFSRTLLLPDEIDRENVDAKVENGLLTLGLNVHPKAQPRKINVAYAA